MAQEARAQHEEKIIALLEQVLASATREGVFHVMDPRGAATALMLAMRGIDPIHRLLFDPPDLEKVVDDMVELFIKGLKAP